METAKNFFYKAQPYFDLRKEVKDTISFAYDLLELALDYKFLQQINAVKQVATILESGLLIEKIAFKPVRIVQLFVKSKEAVAKGRYVEVAGCVAKAVKDTFKWIDSAQQLLPVDLYYLAGFTAFTPQIAIMLTCCSIISDIVKAIDYYDSSQDVRDKLYKKWEYKWNDTSENIKAKAQEEYKNDVICVQNNRMADQNTEIWEEWDNLCVKLNKELPSKTDPKELERLIFDCESWLAKAKNESGEDNPILTIAMESIEWALISMLHDYKAFVALEPLKQRCDTTLTYLYQGKENRIFRNRFQRVTEVAKFVLKIVAVVLMQRANEAFKIFRWFTLINKGLTVAGYIVNWRRPLFSGPADSII